MLSCHVMSGVSYHDCDDDGETAAGGRLGEVLRIMGITGVAVIVSRWFGGTLLGNLIILSCDNAYRALGLRCS